MARFFVVVGDIGLGCGTGVFVVDGGIGRISGGASATIFFGRFYILFGFFDRPDERREFHFVVRLLCVRFGDVLDTIIGYGDQLLDRSAGTSGTIGGVVDGIRLEYGIGVEHLETMAIFDEVNALGDVQIGIQRCIDVVHESVLYAVEGHSVAAFSVQLVPQRVTGVEEAFVEESRVHWY